LQESSIAYLQGKLRDAGHLEDAILPPAAELLQHWGGAVTFDKPAAEPPPAAAAAGEGKSASATYLSDEDEPVEYDEMTPEIQAEVDKFKNEGNGFFKAQQYKEASQAYGKAMKLLDKCGNPDVKIISNRAASMLAMDKFVAAAFDGQRCMEVDPDWWKGYWYRGQALMKMLKGKPPSTSMAERCEQAKIAFQDCLKTTTLPDAKRPQVEMELQNSKNTLMSMTTACNQS